MQILVINGPNINMLGTREPKIYGDKTYEDLCNMITDYCDKKNIGVHLFQSNYEGEIIEKIQKAHSVIDGIVINPAAYTHTSIGILDALKAVGIPAVEVHISDPDKREKFRHISYVREYCEKTVKGKGFYGYIEAIEYLCKREK